MKRFLKICFRNWLLPIVGGLAAALAAMTTAEADAGPAQTIGGGTRENPAVGPGPSFGLGGDGFVLVKNWKFGSNGTIKNIADLSANFQYHDQFGTICCGNHYGAVIVAPDAANRINDKQPVEDPAHPVRKFFPDSMQTYLIGLNGATTVSPSQHNAGNGSFQAKWKLASGGSHLGQDIVWETRVRYVTPKYFWFAIWSCGNIWSQGAEMDVIESFGYDNGGGSTNYKGDYWHSNSVGGTDKYPYGNWGETMAKCGIKSFDATAYHIWTWVYRKDDTYQAYVDGVQVQSGKLIWTVGSKPNGAPIDMDFIFDGSWGHDQVSSVNHPLPTSAFDGMYYEWDYSRVYLR